MNLKTARVFDSKGGDIIKAQLQLNKNAPHQLILQVTSSFSMFSELLTLKGFGVRIQLDNQDLAFIFKSRKRLDNHTVELTMMSYSYKLKHSVLNNRGRVLRNYSIQQFLGELASDFNFINISGSANINLTCGNNDNLTLLNKAVEYPSFFDWVDLGVEDVGGTLTPVIAYGDFREIDDYYDSTGDQRLKPVAITNNRTLDNIYDDDLVLLDQASELDSTVGFSLVYPFCNTGTQASDNTTVVLRRTNYTFVNPQFPIVAKTSPVTGETLYYVRNPFNPLEEEQIHVYEYQEASTTQDQAGNFTTQTEVTEQILYRRTVAYIQSMQSRPTLSIAPTYKKLIMPGTRSSIDFYKEIKDYDGSINYIQQFQGDYIFDSVEYDLSLL